MFRFKLLSTLFFVFAPLSICAQLENSVWVFPKTNLLRFDSTGVVEMQALDGPNDYNWMPASICDKDGNLLFYTKQTSGNNKTKNRTRNNFFNSNHAIVAPDLNIGDVYSIILPDISVKKQYIIVTFKREDLNAQTFNEIVYHTYSIEENGGNGGIVASNTSIHKLNGSQQFSFSLGLIRHANNRDWWILAREKGNSVFYIFLYSSSGFLLVNRIDLRFNINERFSYELRQFTTTEDGKHILMTSVRDGVYLLSFNRCKGSISFNKKILSYTPGQNTCRDGIFITSGFSKNDKYIYVLHQKRLMRFEMDDLEAEPETLAVIQDTLAEPLYIGFHDMRFAPDGKLYITCTPWDCDDGLFHEWSGVSDYLAVVREPDSADCRFEFRGLKLPNHTTAMLPRQAPFEMPPLGFADLPEVPDDTLRRCSGGPPVALHPAGMRYENISYRWEPAAGLDDPNAHNPKAAPETTTTYTLYLEGLQESCWPGDTLSRTVTVEVAPPPKLLTERETALCPGETVLLQVDADTGWACRWAPAATLADPLACQTLARPQTATTYTLTAEHEQCGGFYQAEVAVEVKTCGLPPLPGAFSPNGDGINDAWPAFQNADFVSYSLKIYDRWGRELYTTTNPQTAWDGSANGTPAPEGVYFYRLDASTAEGAVVGKSGSLTVVR